MMNRFPGIPFRRRFAGYRIHPFNMVEIVLALGVVTIGVISIMGLFPVGLTASRDAMAESYAAEAGDQFLHYFENWARQDWANRIVPNGVLPNSKPAGDDDIDLGSSSPVNNTQGTLYNGATAGKYKIIRYVDQPDSGGTADEYDSAFDILDYEAIMLIWKEQVELPNGTLIPYDRAVVLNAEISWPAQLPYSQRTTSYYRLELFNRN